MLVCLLLGITVFVALLSMVCVWLGARDDLRFTWHRVLAATALAVFVYLYGTWIYISIYAKYVFGILFVLSFMAGLLNKKKTRTTIALWKIVPNLFFTLLFGALAILYFTGSTGRPAKVELAFPLKTGKYFILQGGKGLPTNFFHYSYRGAIYAIDIVKLDERGRRANHIFSPVLEDYLIYNDTVFSPCDGRVLRARDENPDNTPPIRNRGPSNTNQVLIETDSFYVFMGHLKQKGVFVHEGDLVKKGQPLAVVGNSGFSLEPHLHIQAHRNTGKSSWFAEEPLYIEFDGRAYLMFETIRPKRVDMVDK
jgi:hypothetical protein